MPRDDAQLVLNPEVLLRAYTAGVFPMADEDEKEAIYWVDPKLRGVLPLDEFHLPRRLARTIRNTPYMVTVDHSFEAVMAGCAARASTWINETILDLYSQLHKLGFAHSIEVWDEDDLIGGLYGVSIGGAFFGESMFSRAPDASKIALTYLVARLKLGGYSLLDTQFTTSHLDKFGVLEIPRGKYHQLLDTAVETPADFFRMPEDLLPQDVLQLITHTS